jgi:hypothetical protein
MEKIKRNQAAFKAVAQNSQNAIRTQSERTSGNLLIH